MALPKNLSIATVRNKLDKEGNVLSTYIALGKKSKTPSQYDLTVEVVVKDAKGKVVARQTDGFLEVVNPRTLPDQLLEKNIITEEQAEKMRARVANMPEEITRELRIKTA